MLFVVISTVFLIVSGPIGSYTSDSPLKDAVEEMVELAKYPLEMYTVQTQDGYLLRLHRIPHGKKENVKPKEVVLMMHGLFCSAADWLVTGPENSLAFILADAGYDVWLGNARGNTYSRKHARLNPESPEFWNFSWHEIGILDIPAIIDVILRQTNVTGLHYVGHSQGVTAFLVMASERSDYNSKIISMTAMAPAAFMGHTISPVVKNLARYTDTVDFLFKAFDIYEFMPSSEMTKILATFLCSDKTTTQYLCINLLFTLVGYDPKQLNKTLLPAIFENIPAGISAKQFVHYGQLVQSGKFQMFDYKEKNIRRYGQPHPPLYDLSKVITPLVLIFGTGDIVLAIKDIDILQQKLPNVIGVFEIPNFNHLDFLFAIDAPKLIYSKVLSNMQKSNSSAIMDLVS